MDAITNEIVRHLSILPFTKKKAILELLRGEMLNQVEFSHEKWKKALLNTSVWTEAEINAIDEAREYINQ